MELPQIQRMAGYAQSTLPLLCFTFQSCLLSCELKHRHPVNGQGMFFHQRAHPALISFVVVVHLLWSSRLWDNLMAKNQFFLHEPLFLSGFRPTAMGLLTLFWVVLRILLSPFGTCRLSLLILTLSYLLGLPTMTSSCTTRLIQVSGLYLTQVFLWVKLFF